MQRGPDRKAPFQAVAICYLEKGPKKRRLSRREQEGKYWMNRSFRCQNKPKVKDLSIGKAAPIPR